MRIRKPTEHGRAEWWGVSEARAGRETREHVADSCCCIAQTKPTR